MKISEISYGWITTLLVEQTYQQPFPTGLISGTELFLYTRESTQQIILGNQNESWPIVGVRTQDQQFLSEWYIHGQPQLIWFLNGTPKNLPTRIVIQIHQFPSKFIWPFPLEIGIDEGIVEEVQKKCPSAKNSNSVQDWLRQQLLLEHPYSQKARIFISHNQNNHSLSNSPASYFRLYGINISADVILDDNNLKIVRLSNNRANKEIPITLAEVDIRFCDSTMASKISGETLYQLNQFIESESYLNLWREYNFLERQSLSNKARRFGYFSYTNWKCQDGRYYFELLDYPDLIGRLEQLATEEELEFETRETIPEELIASDIEIEKNLTNAQTSSPFIGRVVLTPNDIEQKRIVLEPTNDDDFESNLPPKQGYLFYTLFGDYRRLERRSRSEIAIRSGRCPMPQLSLILEGQPIPNSHSQNISPISSKLKAKFPKLNSTQKEAIRIALNTPDIALIQGPPGTGKTTVISAILNRIAEVTKNDVGLSGLVLLTSYQHEAVLNAADRVEIYGLPAMKVGQKRGDSLHRESQKRALLWAKEKVENIQNKVLQFPMPNSYKELQNLIQLYIVAPEEMDILWVLDKVADLSYEWIPIKLRDKLQEYRIKIRHGLPIINIDAQISPDIISAAQELPISPAQFLESGTFQSGKLLERLKGMQILEKTEIELLEKASSWFDPEPPPFLLDLATLKKNILKKLQIRETQNSQQLLIENQKLLTEVLEAMSQELRNTPYSRAILIQNYIHDLQNDSTSVEESLLDYTAVLAATCQQAASRKICSLKDNELVYDTVIVDEAARANPLDLFIPMAQAKRRIILVGDHRQLPQMLEPDLEANWESKVSEQIQKRWHESLFERLFHIMKEHEKRDGVRRTITLDTQYRMHHILGEFVSQQFYEIHNDSKIESGISDEDLKHNLPDYIDKKTGINKVAAWIDVPLSMGSEQKGQSKSRLVEAQYVAQELQKLMFANPQLSFGVISFYSAQIREIQKQLSHLGIMLQSKDNNYTVAPEWRYLNHRKGKFVERLRIGTVDAFQGREFDVVLLSITRSNSYPYFTEQDLRRKYGHLMFQNRLCVAMSRQKRLLIAVGDSGMLKVPCANEVIRPLVEFYKLCEGPYGCCI